MCGSSLHTDLTSVMRGLWRIVAGCVGCGGGAGRLRARGLFCCSCRVVRSFRHWRPCSIMNLWMNSQRPHRSFLALQSSEWHTTHMCGAFFVHKFPILCIPVGKFLTGFTMLFFLVYSSWWESRLDVQPCYHRYCYDVNKLCHCLYEAFR